MSIRVATFNLENLFARYRFMQNFDAITEDGFTINDLAFTIYEENSKRITAKAIRAVKADIICLQEVESLPVLDRFNSYYLGGMNYKHRVLVDSHDPRFIDVAILSRFPVKMIKTYRHERNQANTAFLFARDCLEVDMDVCGKPLTLYVNHFKSMIGGRLETKPRREEQVQRVAEIVDERWGAVDYEGNFIVLGDFNDYVDEETALSALVNHEGLVNVVRRLPEDEQWTHFYSKGNEYRQLDYLLLSRSLAETSPGRPQIMRKGMPYRAEKYTDERFESVGENYPKASDHAPLSMDIELP